MQHLICKLRNTEDVLLRFGGKSEHEVKLHGVPSALKGKAAGVKKVFLTDVFVYCVTQALASGFGRKGKSAFAGLLYAVHYLYREVVRTERGKRKSDAPRLAIFKKSVAQLRQLAVVA